MIYGLLAHRLAGGKEVGVFLEACRLVCMFILAGLVIIGLLICGVQEVSFKLSNMKIQR